VVPGDNRFARSVSSRPYVVYYDPNVTVRTHDTRRCVARARTTTLTRRVMCAAGSDPGGREGRRCSGSRRIRIRTAVVGIVQSKHVRPLARMSYLCMCWAGEGEQHPHRVRTVFRPCRPWYHVNVPLGLRSPVPVRTPNAFAFRTILCVCFLGYQRLSSAVCESYRRQRSRDGIPICPTIGYCSHVLLLIRYYCSAYDARRRRPR